MITVVAPATSSDLVDLATVKGALGISGTSQDELFQHFIRRASDLIARYCSRVFARETIAEQFRLDDPVTELVLSRFPVENVVSVVEGATTLASNAFEVDSDRGFLVRLQGDRACCWSLGRVSVTYVAGYALPNGAPPALQHATLDLIASYYHAKDRGDPMVKSTNIPDVHSATFLTPSPDADHLPYYVKGALRHFRRLKAR